ncbi:hypothetical protein [Streptomyces lavendulocolor]|uniref:hypothetical protein n=1 Tax=Streptomyces lavendulocolor TaxID=67316 RepID=UPI003C2AB8CF
MIDGVEGSGRVWLGVAVGLGSVGWGVGAGAALWGGLVVGAGAVVVSVAGSFAGWAEAGVKVIAGFSGVMLMSALTAVQAAPAPAIRAQAAAMRSSVRMKIASFRWGHRV